MENPEKHSIRKRDKVKQAVRNLFNGKEPLQEATESYSPVSVKYQLDKLTEEQRLSSSSGENVSASMKCVALVPQNAKKPNQDALSKEGNNEMAGSSGSNDLSPTRQDRGHEMENPEERPIRKRDKVKQVIRYIFHGKEPENEPAENYSEVLPSSGGGNVAVNIKCEALVPQNAKKPDPVAASEEEKNELGESSGSNDLSLTREGHGHETENTKEHSTRKRDKLKQVIRNFFNVNELLQEAIENYSHGKLTQDELQYTISGGNAAVNIKCDAMVAEDAIKSDPDSSAKERKYELGESSQSNNLLPKTQTHHHEMEHTAQHSIGKWGILKQVIHIRFQGKQPAKEQPENYSSPEMGRSQGSLRVNVIKGNKLVTRDIVSSDPYVILTLGRQRKRTDVIKNNLNPEWNQSLVLEIPDRILPLKLEVYDEDRFRDDKMGDAEIDIEPLLQAAKEQESGASRSGSGRSEGCGGETKTLQFYPRKDDNALCAHSKIRMVEGRVQQKMTIQLENVEHGQVEIELEYIPATQ